MSELSTTHVGLGPKRFLEQLAACRAVPDRGDKLPALFAEFVEQMQVAVRVALSRGRGEVLRGYPLEPLYEQLVEFCQFALEYSFGDSGMGARSVKLQLSTQLADERQYRLLLVRVRVLSELVEGVQRKLERQDVRDYVDGARPESRPDFIMLEAERLAALIKRQLDLPGLELFDKEQLRSALEAFEAARVQHVAAWECLQQAGEDGQAAAATGVRSSYATLRRCAASLERCMTGSLDRFVDALGISRAELEFPLDPELDQCLQALVPEGPRMSTRRYWQITSLFQALFLLFLTCPYAPLDRQRATLVEVDAWLATLDTDAVAPAAGRDFIRLLLGDD